MNDPRRHHYNPEFYLGEWAGPDDLVCEIKKAHGKVEARRKSPRATGFQRDLYRTVGVPDEQHVEKNFMSPLDNDAARALQKILSGDGTEWSGAECTAWTTFILSLFFRNPENVTIIKDHIRDLREHAKAALEAKYAERRVPTFWVLNSEVVCQARKFVWATDESQLELVRRHIGTAPDRTIITEAQKQESLAAARGEPSR
jgi:hypothetical protein